VIQLSQEKENKMKLENLSVKDVELILVALSKLPFEVVAEIYTRIKTSAETQLKEELAKQKVGSEDVAN
jgi:hypothetical protein